MRRRKCNSATGPGESFVSFFFFWRGVEAAQRSPCTKSLAVCDGRTPATSKASTKSTLAPFWPPRAFRISTELEAPSYRGVSHDPEPNLGEREAAAPAWSVPSVARNLRISRPGQKSPNSDPIPLSPSSANPPPQKWRQLLPGRRSAACNLFFLPRPQHALPPA